MVDALKVYYNEQDLLLRAREFIREEAEHLAWLQTARATKDKSPMNGALYGNEIGAALTREETMWVPNSRVKPLQHNKLFDSLRPKISDDHKGTVMVFGTAGDMEADNIYDMWHETTAYNIWEEQLGVAPVRYFTPNKQDDDIL